MSRERLHFEVQSALQTSIGARISVGRTATENSDLSCSLAHPTEHWKKEYWSLRFVHLLHVATAKERGGGSRERDWREKACCLSASEVRWSRDRIDNMRSSCERTYKCLRKCIRTELAKQDNLIRRFV